MNSLKQNIETLYYLRQDVEQLNKKNFTHIKINSIPVTNNTISIIMTSHERSKQVYYTLDTLNNSTFKDIQVIIVDDSDYDCVSPLIIEENYQFNVDLIKINRKNKNWINPCVNYNIGFKFILGNKVIIQNSEVCHVGDILDYVHKNINDEKYYVFDVKATRDFTSNQIIYDNKKLSTAIFNINNIWNNMFKEGWYQHHEFNNRNFHFLTALTKASFDKIKEFSYDYSYGSCYDDDDFLLKVKILNFEIINIKNEIENIGGIHLYHEYTNNKAYIAQQNKDLFEKKVKYFKNNGFYLELSLIKDISEIKKQFFKLLSA